MLMSNVEKRTEPHEDGALEFTPRQQPIIIHSACILQLSLYSRQDRDGWR